MSVTVVFEQVNGDSFTEVEDDDKTYDSDVRVSGVSWSC